MKAKKLRQYNAGVEMVKILDEVWGHTNLVDINVEKVEDYVLVLRRLIEMAGPDRESSLVQFLYLLMHHQLPVGTVESLAKEAIKRRPTSALTLFDNPRLAQCAAEIAEHLVSK